MHEPNNVDRRATAGASSPLSLGSINFGPFDPRAGRLPPPEGRLLPRTTFPVEGLLGEGAPPRREVDQIHSLADRLERLAAELVELRRKLNDRIDAIAREVAALRTQLTDPTGRASAPTEEIAAMAQQKPSTGRIVHFVGEVGEVRPAIIIAPCVERFPGSSYTRDECQLHVFWDGTNDATGPRDPNLPPQAPNAWRTSVPYDEHGGANTWHWPPRT